MNKTPSEINPLFFRSPSQSSIPPYAVRNSFRRNEVCVGWMRSGNRGPTLRSDRLAADVLLRATPRHCWAGMEGFGRRYRWETLWERCVQDRAAVCCCAWLRGAQLRGSPARLPPCRLSPERGTLLRQGEARSGAGPWRRSRSLVVAAQDPCASSAQGPVSIRKRWV
jgi:hypothetical protein